MKELQPVNQHVVIDITKDNKEQRTAGGIIIPDTSREKPQMAPIIAIGVIENAELVPGDIVIFKPYSGTEIDFEGKKYLILPYADILAKIVETEEI
ncbi:MAG: co-chaperone GroES [Lentimicrobiaceae bacterium]|jgi:chaperonin GroES